MTNLRLIADDLTGALDTAAEFVGMTGPVEAFWHGDIPAVLPANAALDSGTRELEPDAATRAITRLAPLLNGGGIAFKKVDSLMRGPTLAEVAACARAGKWRQAVLAPAFPYQGRATRGGIQYARDMQGHWAAVSGDIVAQLRELGIQAQPGQFDKPLPAGISVFDAETDADLDCVVATARAASRVLWIGTGGLAQALARHAPAPVSKNFPRPLLGLFGSDHAVTAQQLAACGTDWISLTDGGPAEAQSVAAHLRSTGLLMASIELPTGLGRGDAARRIGMALHRLVRAIPAPKTHLVAGGTTLHSLCRSLEARSLVIQGRVVPGVPRSLLRGGLWDGVTVISKSGAFGSTTLLRDLLRGAHVPAERMH